MLYIFTINFSRLSLFCLDILREVAKLLFKMTGTIYITYIIPIMRIKIFNVLKKGIPCSSLTLFSNMSILMYNLSFESFGFPWLHLFKISRSQSFSSLYSYSWKFYCVCWSLQLYVFKHFVQSNSEFLVTSLVIDFLNPLFYMLMSCFMLIFESSEVLIKDTYLQMALNPTSSLCVIGEHSYLLLHRRIRLGASESISLP